MTSDYATPIDCEHCNLAVNEPCGFRSDGNADRQTMAIHLGCIVDYSDCKSDHAHHALATLGKIAFHWVEQGNEIDQRLSTIALCDALERVADRLRHVTRMARNMELRHAKEAAQL
jgi:hypothetical protein